MNDQPDDERARKWAERIVAEADVSPAWRPGQRAETVNLARAYLSACAATVSSVPYTWRES